MPPTRIDRKKNKRSINVILTPNPKEFVKRLRAENCAVNVFNLSGLSPERPGPSVVTCSRSSRTRTPSPSSSSSSASSTTSARSRTPSLTRSTTPADQEEDCQSKEMEIAGLLFGRNTSRGNQLDPNVEPTDTHNNGSTLPPGPILGPIPSVHPKVTLNADQEIAKKPTDKTTGQLSHRVVIEIFKVNGELFDGVLSDSDLFELWECLGREVTEIKKKGSEQIKGVCLRVAYFLKEPVQLTDISTKPEFSVNKKTAFRTDVHRIRLPDFDTIAYTLGQEVTITIQNTLFRFSEGEMVEWIRPFGEVVGVPRSVMGEQGIETDDYEINTKLKNHVPEILPMQGKRVQVSYPGQPKLCKNCFCQGHIARECPDSFKSDFIKFVAKLVKSGLFRENLFGSWLDTLAKYHPDFNRPNPQDLRQVMTYNQRGVHQQDLRRRIGYATNSDLRNRIGFNQHQLEPSYDQQRGVQSQYQDQGQIQHYQDQNYYHQGQGQQFQERQFYQPRTQNNARPYRGRGRGRARGRNFNNHYY